MKPLLLVTGPVATRSGYGSHTRDLVKSLIKMDKYDIKINSLKWGNCPMNALDENNPEDRMIKDKILLEPRMERQPDVHIQISVPNEFTAIGRYNIGVTAGIETTACAATWIEGCNRMDLILVPSNFTKEVMGKTVFEKIDEVTKQKTGDIRVNKPIEVLFEGVDTNIYKKTSEISDELQSEMSKIKEKFAFLYTGHWLQGNLGEDRKDTGMLVKTFLETFKNYSNPPALVMKTSGATFSVIDRNDIQEKIESIKASVNGKLPNVYFLHGDLTDVQMNELYNHSKVKVHISFTHGEGYGRPLLEATMSEKPVVASNWSGHIDFLEKQYSTLLSGAMTKVPDAAFPPEMMVEGAQWFSVNYQYASKVMKKMYKTLKKDNQKARKLANFNKSKFSMDAMTKKFQSILEQYVPKIEQPQPVSLKLPKLKKVN